MQRRYLFIATVALAALVLIPAAALAGGAGPGNRGGGPKNLTAVGDGWAGNGSAPAWAACNSTHIGDHLRNARCVTDGICAKNMTTHRDRAFAGNITGGLNRTAVRGGACPANATLPAEGDHPRLRGCSGPEGQSASAGIGPVGARQGASPGCRC